MEQTITTVKDFPVAEKDKILEYATPTLADAKIPTCKQSKNRSENCFPRL